VLLAMTLRLSFARSGSDVAIPGIPARTHVE
jgi:hypothetical protein